jgi:hypothetical protein
MIKVVQNFSPFFGSIWLTRPITIHNTVHSSVRHTIKDSMKISKSNLTLTLIDLGYTYKKIGDNRRVLYNQVSIINDRCSYLRKIKSFREAGYDIVYMDGIIETVGAIFREYKPWIVLLITQWSKSSKILALSLGLFDLQGLLPFIIRYTEV